MKKYILVLVVVILVWAGLFFFGKESEKNISVSHLNASYTILGREVKLVNGEASEESAPGSASQVVTKYFGSDVKADFDGDGREDVAFILTQSPGGSGTFYYLVTALNKESGFVGSKAVLLGDRIAPQTTRLERNNIVEVNFADRAYGEDFSVRPSVGKTMWFQLDPKTMDFGIVEPNFSGEADPKMMKLDMKSWNWISTSYSDGTTIKPKKQNIFTLTLGKDGKFSAKTDCNSVAGSYTLNQNEIFFGQMISTKMYCEGSQEADFTKILGQVASYFFTSKGELVFDHKFDTGSSIFK